MKTEIWKDIIGYEGFYQISNLGNCINLTTRKIIKPVLRGKGYCNTRLSKNGERKNFATHRLAALHFIPNIENKPQVNHKDGNKHNNCVDNLEWVTGSENKKHSYRILGNKTLFQTNHPSKGKFGKDNIKSKKINQYDLDGNFIKTWDSMMDIQRELGFLTSSISIVCKMSNNRKTAYNFIWKYENKH